MQGNDHRYPKADLSIGQPLAVAKGKHDIDFEQCVRAKGRTQRIGYSYGVVAGVCRLNVAERQRSIGRVGQIVGVESPLIEQRSQSGGNYGERYIRAGGGSDAYRQR